jgi:hypothetical protein
VVLHDAEQWQPECVHLPLQPQACLVRVVAAGLAVCFSCTATAAFFLQQDAACPQA